MPRVPQYQRQVRETGLSNARVSANAPIEAFGGGQGAQQVTQATLGLMDATQKYVHQERNKADQVALLAADEQLSRFETEYLYAPQTGALNLSGQDSFALPDRFEEDFKKKVAEIEQSLASDNQRQAFYRRASSRRNDMDRRIQQHVSKQFKDYDSTVTNSYIQNEKNAAMSNYMDSSRVNEAIQLQQAVIYDHAKRNGLPSEWIKQKIEETVSDTHASVMSRMLANGEDMDAKKYYEKNRDSFTGQDIVRMEKALEEGSLRGESQRRSDSILGKAMGLSESLEEARRIEDPKLRDETVRRVRDRFNEKSAEQKELQDRLFEDSALQVEQSRSLDVIEPETLANMSANQRKYLRQLAAGTGTPTNWNKYYDFKSMYSNPLTRKQFLDINMIDHRHEFSDSEFKEMVNMQAQLRSGSKDAEMVATGYRTTQQVVDGALRSIGIQPGAKGNKGKQAEQFRRMVDEEIASLQQQTGKKIISKEEVQGIVDNLMVEGRIPGRMRIPFFSGAQRAFQVEPGQAFEVRKAKDIPNRELNKIRDAMERNGMRYDEAEAVRIYNMRLQGMIGGS